MSPTPSPTWTLPPTTFVMGRRLRSGKRLLSPAGAVGARWAETGERDIARLDAPALAGPFELVVFDPPKIASSRRDLGRATGAMRMALAQLLPRLSDAGSILVCSCSHHLGWDALDRVLVEAAAGRPLARIARWGAGLDHPVAPGHAEGEYLRAALYQRR